jgi:hypothetical protein
MMVRIGIEVYVSVSFLPIDLGLHLVDQYLITFIHKGGF